MSKEVVDLRTIANKWCPVCDGYGGWNIQTNKPRFRLKEDTSDTYMSCLWCGQGNVIVRLIP